MIPTPPSGSTPLSWPVPFRHVGPQAGFLHHVTTTDASPRFRPIHRLDGGAVCGADVMTGPDHWNGSVQPDEQARWLLHEASYQASLCEHPLTLCVALPPFLAYTTQLVCAAQAALRVWAPDVCALELVLSEPEIPQAGADLLLTLSALRDLDIGIAVQCPQDVRAGLAQMCRLPLTCVRLPANLASDVPHSRPARLAVAQVVQAAQEIDATAMAQGVQSAAQRDILADLGCSSAQGSLFGHPMPGTTFQTALLRP